jgi:hypothetical protein
MNYRQLLIISAFIFTSTLNLAKADDTIKLIHAQIDQACSTCGSLSGSIRLKNLSFVKDVDVFYQSGHDSTWYSIPAEFNNMDQNNSEEIWSFKSGSLSEILVGKTQFAIRYEVNGRVFWDNNCNQNYILDMRTINSNYGNRISEVNGSDCQ